MTYLSIVSEDLARKIVELYNEGQINLLLKVDLLRLLKPSRDVLRRGRADPFVIHEFMKEKFQDFELTGYSRDVLEAILSQSHYNRYYKGLLKDF